MTITLKPQQSGFYKRFKNLGEKNKGVFISRIVEFIRGELGFDPETGNCRFKAIIGISGGVDSAVVLALAVKAVGADNVIGIKMPYRGISSRESIAYADLLMEEFKVGSSYEIAINGIVDSLVAGIAKEGVILSAGSKGNVMARARMSILYALANQAGGKVLDTCNRTELRMGYFTKYGDGASDFNPVGMLYKTWIWIIAQELGVPREIINRKPSAELIAWNQKDEDDMGISYAALDLMLYYMDEKIGERALSTVYSFDPDNVRMVSKRIDANKHKNQPSRICNPKKA